MRAGPNCRRPRRRTTPPAAACSAAALTAAARAWRRRSAMRRLQRPAHRGVLLALLLGPLQRHDLLARAACAVTARFSAASWDWRLAVSSSAFVRSRSSSGRLVRLDVLRAGLGGGLRVLIGLELVAHPAAQDEPAGVDPALHVAQDGELLDRLPQLRGLGFDDGLLRGDPGQLVLGPRHFGLGVGEGLGGDVGLLAGLQDLACRLLRRTLVLVGRLRGRSAHPARAARAPPWPGARRGRAPWRARTDGRDGAA